MICIADISVLISSDNKDVISKIKEEYSNFITDKLSFKIKLNVTFEENNSLAEFKGKLYPLVEFNDLDKSYSVSRESFFGKYNVEQREGTLICSDLIYVNSFLRFIYSIILPAENGFLIHACSVKKNEDAYLFPGKSGAGKTTIAEISKKSTVLTDEISLIRKIDKQFIAFGTPFWGKGLTGTETTHSPVKGVYFPIKDLENYIVKINPQEALKMLLSNVVFYSYELENTEKLFGLCLDFLGEIPSYKLHFLPEPTFWRCIDAR